MVDSERKFGVNPVCKLFEKYRRQMSDPPPPPPTGDFQGKICAHISEIKNITVEQFIHWKKQRKCGVQDREEIQEEVWIQPLPGCGQFRSHQTSFLPDSQSVSFTTGRYSQRIIICCITAKSWTWYCPRKYLYEVHQTVREQCCCTFIDVYLICVGRGCSLKSGAKTAKVSPFPGVRRENRILSHSTH